MNLIEICVHHLLLLLIVRIDLNRCETISSSKEVRPCLSKSIEEILIDSEEKTFDCSTLSSDVQTFLALQLTFCHLNSTGIDPKEICSLTRTTFNQQQCLKNLTRNPFAYLTYTNFLPHIQSLCYSIETQRWHHQTHRTIHQLHQHTNQIESEAKNLLIEQENIQHRLDQTLLINQNSVDDALSIDRFLQTAQTDVEDLRGHLYVKDKAQIELIHQILDTLFNIQSTLFTDAFGLSSYIFYALTLIAIHLLTIPERTNDSKFWLILLWIGLITIERYMLLFSSYNQMLLYDALWRFRQFWFFISCFILTYYAIRYRNFRKENQRLIDEIDRKHQQLERTARKCLNVIKQLEISDDSMSDDFGNETFDQQTNSSNNSLMDDDLDEE